MTLLSLWHSRLKNKHAPHNPPQPSRSLGYLHGSYHFVVPDGPERSVGGDWLFLYTSAGGRVSDNSILTASTDHGKVNKVQGYAWVPCWSNEHRFRVVPHMSKQEKAICMMAGAPNMKHSITSLRSPRYQLEQRLLVSRQLSTVHYYPRVFAISIRPTAH